MTKVILIRSGLQQTFKGIGKLLQVQNLLASQSDEGTDRLREAQIAFVMDEQDE